MKRLLEHRDAWGNPAAIWVLAVATFAIPLIIYGLTFVRVENSVENWLPAHDPHAKTFAWYCGHFDKEDKILMSWRGSHVDDPRIDKLATMLRGELDQFGVRRDGSRYLDSVMTPNDAIREITRYDVSRADAIDRLTGILIGPNHGPAALVVSLNEAGHADPASAVAELRDFGLAAGVPADALALGGSAVGSSALNQEMKKASWNPDVPPWMLHKSSPVLLSALASVFFAVVLLRNARITIYVLGVTLLATIAAVAVIPALGSTMNMVLVVMPTLLMVLMLSAAIHLINYYRHAVTEGDRDPAAKAVRVAWWPCILANFTTSLGLISLVTSPLSPVRDFGFFSAIGCMIALPVALCVLPGMMQIWPVPVKKVAPRPEGIWRHVGEFLVSARWFVILGSVLLFVAGLYGLRSFRTETKAIRYFPPEARVVQEYYFLEENLSGIVPIETVISFGPEFRKATTFLERLEIVRRATGAIRQHPEISGALSLAEFQPVIHRPDPASSFSVKAAYHRRSATVEQRVKEQVGNQPFLAICKESPAQLDGEAVRTMAPGDELWRITAHAAIMSDADYSGIGTEIEAIVAKAVGEKADYSCVVTGAIPLLLRTQEAVVESLIVSFGMAFVMIALVMCWLLRSLSAGLFAMLPNLIPVTAVFGAVSWCGIAVDIGTMITASVALGIAVDGTLHFSETFKQRVATMSRRKAAIAALACCGPALCQTGLVIGGGLIMLAWAELLLVCRFGWLMAVVVWAATLANLILLPALLAGPLGAVLERTVRRQECVPGASRWIPAPHAWRSRRCVKAASDS